MLKRLIEVALPLKEVSQQSAREKSIRHGHISTLHIWWARRPLAACRAAVFASLIPDPDDPECPESFRELVMELLGRSEFKPTDGEGAAVSDTPRNRCLEFIKQLVKWENSNKPEYIEPARKLIAAAHKFLHPDSEGEAPKVLDPFAGGGAIPLEALRLDCEAHAIDLNPVAHLIELCTLVYPQKFGQPDSRPVPDYIKRLVAHNRAKKKVKGEAGLFDKDAGSVAVADDEIIPDVEITEAEYRKNPLAADVKYWGHWVLKRAEQELARFYPRDSDGSVPVAYIWARTISSPDPTAKAHIPLIRSFWLCKKGRAKYVLEMTPNRERGRCEFTVADPARVTHSFDGGTMRRGDATCPFSGTVAPVKYLRAESRAGRMGQQLVAVVSEKATGKGRNYRAATTADEQAFIAACACLEEFKREQGVSVVPDEPLPPVGTLGFRVNNYGLTKWGDLFNGRQLLALVTFAKWIREATHGIRMCHEQEYADGAITVLATNFGRAPDHWASLCTWNPSGPKIQHVFGRQALPMVWDYAEANPFGGSVGDYAASILWNGCNAVSAAAAVTDRPALCHRGSATAIPMEDGTVAAVITDPPYYDAVPYSDLSDFFYVWHKRTLSQCQPDLFRTPVTPKTQELISYGPNGSPKNDKTPAWFEARMGEAFAEINRVLGGEGIVAVMFAHKTTTAWERIVTGLVRNGLVVTASWPFHTEMRTRLRAMDSAALASSVTLVCRKRGAAAGNGLWDDVRKELQTVAHERLDFFWSQGIRGADFFISAIGPALSVFGKYERVTKLSGEEVTVGQFLDEVRGLVTNYALAKIATTKDTKATKTNAKGGKGAGLGQLDPETKFYVMWKWSYGDAKAPADESFKLAQALGISTETIWDRSGVLERSGENVQALSVAKRMKIKDLGEPSPTGAPASLIDVLHRMCVYRDKGDTAGLAEFLAKSGQGANPSLWLVAQAISEILPDGDKEKQLMQGLLNQKEQLEEAQGRLF